MMANGFGLGGAAEGFLASKEAETKARSQEGLDWYRQQEVALAQQGMQNAERRKDIAHVDAARTGMMTTINETIQALQAHGADPATIAAKIQPLVQPLKKLTASSGFDPSSVDAQIATSLAKPPVFSPEQFKTIQVEDPENPLIKKTLQFDPRKGAWVQLPPGTGGAGVPGTVVSASATAPSSSAASVQPAGGLVPQREGDMPTPRIQEAFAAMPSADPNAPAVPPGAVAALQQAALPRAQGGAPAATGDAGSDTGAVSGQGSAGDQYLATLPAGIRNIVKGIGDYEIDPRSSSARTGNREKLLGLVKEYNPQWNQQEYNARSAAVNQFARGPESRTVRSFNVLVSHLDVLKDATAALQNKDIQLFNSIKNTIAAATGSTAPTDFNGVKAVVGTELIKAIMGGGAGAGALADREEIKKDLAQANSEKQLFSLIDKYQKLAAGQLGGLRQQYEGTTGRKDFDRFLDPRTKKLFSEDGSVRVTPPAGGGSSLPPPPAGFVIQ